MRLPLLILVASLFAAPALGFDAIDSVIPAPAWIQRFSGFSPSNGPVNTAIEAARQDLGEEGYSLLCDRSGFTITAATNRGLNYGRITLDQMRAAGRVPCCKIIDKPAFKVRAVMLDLARLKEKHEYYYHVIDELARWKINTVFLHLTDSGGCAIEIKRYPSMATRNAFSQNDMRKLIRYAAERNIELIPEIESWGHAGYIGTLPEFKDIGEDGQHTLCTSNPRTFEVLASIYAEIAALFPSKYLHVGCDESTFGKCALCKPKVANGTDALVGEHLSKVSELVTAAGKTPMMWGDVLMRNRKALDTLPQNTVICSWDYKAPVRPEPVQFLKGTPFRQIACPALVWGGRMLLPAPDTFDNIRSFAKLAAETNCTGIDTTVWVPSRYISDTLPFGLAYASEMSWSLEKRSRRDFAKAFASGYFHMQPNNEIADALWNVHKCSTTGGSIFTGLWNYRGQFDKLSGSLLRYTMPARDQAVAVSGVLHRYASQPSAHKEEFAALVLAADAAVHMSNRAVSPYALTRHFAAAKQLLSDGNSLAAMGRLDDAARLLTSLIDQEAAMAGRLEASWDRWRYPDDPQKFGSGQNLLKNLRISDGYMKAILQHIGEAHAHIAAGEPVDWSTMLQEPERQQD